MLTMRWLMRLRLIDHSDQLWYEKWSFPKKFSSSSSGPPKTTTTMGLLLSLWWLLRLAAAAAAASASSTLRQKRRQHFPTGLWLATAVILPSARLLLPTLLLLSSQSTLLLLWIFQWLCWETLEVLLFLLPNSSSGQYWSGMFLRKAMPAMHGNVS